jgi:hypothetical protein
MCNDNAILYLMRKFPNLQSIRLNSASHLCIKNYRSTLTANVIAKILQYILKTPSSAITLHLRERMIANILYPLCQNMSMENIPQVPLVIKHFKVGESVERLDGGDTTIETMPAAKHFYCTDCSSLLNITMYERENRLPPHMHLFETAGYCF